jgi:hypothetical protein
VPGEGLLRACAAEKVNTTPFVRGWPISSVKTVMIKAIVAGTLAVAAAMVALVAFLTSGI